MGMGSKGRLQKRIYRQGRNINFIQLHFCGEENYYFRSVKENCIFTERKYQIATTEKEERRGKLFKLYCMMIHSVQLFCKTIAIISKLIQHWFKIFIFSKKQSSNNIFELCF